MMNKILILSTIVLLMLSTGYSALTDNLVVYYSFDEATGSTIDNLANSGTSDGTLTDGALSSDTQSLLGKSLYCDGNNDWLSIADSSSLDFDGDFTINFWTYRIADSGWMLSRRPADIFASYLIGGGDSAQLYISNNGGSWGVSNGNDANADLGSWEMLTYTKNATHYGAFLNGVLYYTWSYTTSPLDVSGVGALCRGQGGSYATTYIDEFGMWKGKALSQSEINELYNSDTGYNPYAPAPASYNYNVTKIFDNSSINNNSVRFNVSYNLNFTGYNDTSLTPQLLTLNISSLGIYENITSNVARATIFNNNLISNYSVIVTNPFNSSVTETYYYTINEIVDIHDNSLNHFNLFNTSVNLNFSSICICGGEFFTDYYNLTIPDLNITNRLNQFGINDSVIFNNSLVYNYTVYVSHERFGNLVNETFYFYTNAYNLSIPTYNQTIPNNSNTDIKWYLTTIPNYASSGQNINMSINFNGTTYYPTASGLNYSYITNLITNQIVETIPFNLLLNLTSGNESLLFNSSYSQSIATITFDDCSTYTNQILNISIINERDSNRAELVPNSSLTAYFKIGNGYYAYSTINDTDGIIGICLNNTANFTSNVDFSFTATNYGATTKPNREHFYFNTFFHNTTIQQKLFKLPTSYAEKIIFNLVDTAQQPLTNHYIVLKRWYGDGNEVVAMARTDINGQAITYVEYNEPYYAFDILDANGSLIYSPPENIILTNTPTTIVVTTEATNSYEVDSSTYGYSNTWNNVTNYFSTTMTNENMVDTTFNLLVYYTNGSLICSKTSTTTSSYSTSCLVNNWENNSFIVKGSLIRISDNRHILLYNYIIDDTLPETLVFETNEGFLWLALTMITISVLFVAISPNFLPLSPAISLLITNLIGLTSLSMFIIGGLALAGIIFMLWFMRN